ncbi:response regulator transcription factor [Alkalihalobacillus hemicellulosilyticus]|uniref:Helix-turn-helix n=1 Tax=Halalkalibacter hemicellulosilyticusJCM 9152 TaxID=1236971 RepID=W4QAZ0_9BACI|nr:response regulator [Halalkalibacter hemicellulosilyticus]GAE28838.1 helix-turn-helix [Halalkalibacter hemicellulosilyticusJCM 9152]
MLRVLLVDDEKSALQMIKRLGRWDELGLHVVGETANGQEAADFIQKEQVDIVITDMNMPGVDGVQLLRFIHEKHPQIASVVLSGYDQFSYLQQAIRSNVVEYLLKPVDSDDLHAALGRCIQRLDEERMKKLDHGKLINIQLLPLLNQFKVRIHKAFQERDHYELTRSFNQLYKEIIATCKPIDQSINLKLYNEFLFIAEDQIYRNNLNSSQFVQEELSLYNPQMSIEDLFNEYIKVYQHLFEYIQRAKGVTGKFKLEEVKEYIDVNYSHSTISLGQLSQQFYVSKEYLSKAFKKEFGVNVTEYIMQLRMEKAKVLIVDEKIKIKNVAEMVGYEDVSYFYRVFKKYHGVTPGQV